METNKPKVISNYHKLGKDLQEQVKLMYPDGFEYYLIHYKNAKGQAVTALRFETDEKIYLLRMTTQMAFQIIEDDDDYDEDHFLKNRAKDLYQEKHADVEYLKADDNDA